MTSTAGGSAVATEYDLIVAGDGVHDAPMKEFRDRIAVTADAASYMRRAVIPVDGGWDS
jgi:hypothetical protein